jgi:hypothetical protein
MRKNKNTRKTRRAKFALITLGATFCVGGAYAFAQVVSPSAPAGGQATSAAKSGELLSLRVTPATQSVAAGASARFAIQIRRVNRRRVKLHVPDRVVLSVLDGAPQGTTAVFNRRSTLTSKATLTIVTSAAASGTHRLRLRARSRSHRALATVKIVIGSAASPAPTGNANFSISGDLSSALEPGLAVPFDLSLTNPGPDEITISDLGVNVTGITAPLADESYPCTLDDFSAVPFSGAYGFVVPPTSTRSLSELGFGDAEMPQIEMPDRPVNQNGCKGASLQFDFTGTATGGPA